MSERVWRCGRFELPLSQPMVMGVLNATPDSFSDGGAHASTADALFHARRMVAEGADIIDVGGESTRPGSDEVSPAEELSRVLPLVRVLAADGEVPVSIDTRHAEVARACVEAGAAVINDVSGFRDPAMLELAAGCDAGVVVMHMLGEPKTMQEDPRYEDVVAEVSGWLGERASALEAAGVAHERICLDPGIGFGKTVEHNVELLRRLGESKRLGYALMVGASRKRFIGALTGAEVPAERLGGSLAAAVVAVLHSADIVRVHDVAATVQALRVLASVRGD